MKTKFLFAALLLASSLMVLNNFVWLKQVSAIDTTSPSLEIEKSFSSNNPLGTAIITNLNLFGIANISKVPDSALEDLPVTNLRLILHGVVASTNNNRSTAMVEGSDGTVKNYSIGNEIEDSAIIDNIYNDRIILERRGRLETLYFPEKQNLLSVSLFTETQQTRARPNNSVNASVQPSTQVVESPTQPDLQSRTQINQQQISSTQKSIRERLEELRNMSQ